MAKSKALVDNILKIYKGSSVFNSTTVISLELDLDLPRGYVAAIKGVEIGIKKIEEDLQAVNGDTVIAYEAALVRDPDDTSTKEIPEEDTTHDVLCEIELGISIEEVTAAGFESTQHLYHKNYDFTSKGVDIITARNMRLNCAASGSSAASATEAEAYVILFYTLEKISDEDLLAVLDIL